MLNSIYTVMLMPAMIVATSPPAVVVPPSELALAQTPPSPEVLQQLEFDRSTRMTVPVKINGSEAFDFVVDTGAERTVIAQELGAQLGLQSGRELKLATVSGPATVGSYLIETLTMSAISRSDIESPALKRENLGAFGLLGVDSLADNKLRIDFIRKTMSVQPAKARDRYREAGDGGDVIIVTAKRKAGRLVLTNARIGNMRVDVVIDTGAQGTMGNKALRDKLRKSQRRGEYIEVALKSITGVSMLGDFTQIKTVEIDGLSITDLPVTFTSDYAFKALNLEKRPAILLGMDAMRLFDRVEIDFANKKVAFDLPRGSSRQSPGRFAWNESRTSAMSLSSPVMVKP